MNQVSKPLILLSRELPPLFTDALRSFAELRVLSAASDNSALEGASVFLAAGIDAVPAALIQRFPPSLGLIANIATGTDNIDLKAATQRGIAVSNTPVVAEDTADLTLALLLATCRRLSYCENRLRAGEWDVGAWTMGVRVHGKTLGIVGLGAIGEAVARRASGFGLRILYYGPRRKPEKEMALDVSYREDLNELLAESDIVSLNCPLTEENHHMINADRLATMRAGAVLINTGRGALVDEDALADALISGHLGGAGLDVFEFEPQVNPRLLGLNNVTLLPHIGSATTECRGDMARRALMNIQQYLSDGSPLDRCN